MKRLVMGVAAALACAAAHSQTTTWSFTYTGFESDERVFRPDIVLKGEFSGADLDGDGVLERAELSDFQLYRGLFPVSLLACPSTFEDMYSCSLDRFTYSPEAGLDFAGEHWRGDTHYGHTQSIEADAGSRWVIGSSNGRTGESSYTYYSWTPQTQFAILSAVPEPGQAGLLALGLGMLAAAGALVRQPGFRPARVAPA